MTELIAAVGLLQLALVAAVVVLAAVLRAFTGFGFALAAVPVFSLLMSPAQAVVLSASLAFAISLLTIRTYWGSYPLTAMAPLLAMALAGTGVGVLVLTALSGEQFQLYIGVAVLLACLALTFYRSGRLRPGPWRGAAAGVVSGLLNGAFAIPGPPVILYAMATEPDPARSRSLLLTFFLFSSAGALVMYAVAGLVTTLSLWLFLLAFPAMYVGDKIGYRLFHRHGTTLYRRVALAALYAVGVGIILKALD